MGGRETAEHHILSSWTIWRSHFPVFSIEKTIEYKMPWHVPKPPVGIINGQSYSGP